MKPGDWFWYQDGTSYLSVQLIQPTESGSWLARTFWPTPEIPSGPESLEVRTECSEVAIPDGVMKFHHSELAPEAFNEVAKFMAIRDALTRRNSVFDVGMNDARNQLAAGNFSEALEILNAVGPINKRNPEVYLLRARCFQALGNVSAAEYDYDFYLQLGGKAPLN